MPVVDMEQKSYNGHWAEVILHADKDGEFVELAIDDEFREHHVVEVDLWVKPNDRVSAFRGANDAIGTLVVKFCTEEELVKYLNSQNKWLKIIVK
jgi:hypothetical protein